LKLELGLGLKGVFEESGESGVWRVCEEKRKKVLMDD